MLSNKKSTDSESEISTIRAAGGTTWSSDKTMECGIASLGYLLKRRKFSLKLP